MKTYREFLSGPRDIPTVVAHRGAWHGAPENSIAAIEAAAQAGFEIVEIDVRRSADRVFFVMHDDTLDRTTDRGGACEALTMAQLRETSLRSSDGGCDRPLTAKSVPSLEEALEAARDRIYLDIDIKDPANSVAVAELVAACGMAGQADIKVHVTDAASAETQMKLRDAFDIVVMPKMRFERDTVEARLDLMMEMRPDMVETSFDNLGTIASISDRFRTLGAAMWVNTLRGTISDDLCDRSAVADADAVWGALVAAGVSIIQTDEPELLKSYRNARRQAAE